MPAQFGEEFGGGAPAGLLDMLGTQPGAQAGPGYWAGGERSGGVDANSLMNYVTSTFGGQGPAAYSGVESPQANGANLAYPMTGEAQRFMRQQQFPVDPNRIIYSGGRFTLDSQQGPDLFGGQYDNQYGNMPLSQMPRELQPLLAPSLVRYYKDQDYHGGAARGYESAPWTGFFAPPGANVNYGPYDRSWPGVTHFDPWGRSLGEYQALYS